MTDKTYTPSTEDVRRSYVYAESSSFHAIEPSPKDTPFQRECESPVKVARKRDTEEYRAAREEFDQWLDHVHAEAKQEGFEQALELLESQSEISLDDLEHYKELNPYRSNHE